MFKNKYGHVRSGWKIAAVLAAALAIILFVQVMFIIAALAMTPAVGSLSDMIKGVVSRWEWLLTLLQEVIMIAVPVFAWKKIFKRPLREMGLPCIAGYGAELASGLLLGFIAITLVFAGVVFSGSAQVTSWIPHFSSRTLLNLLIFIFVGFAEEILSRGYVMAALRQTRSVWAVILISSVLFSCMHLLNSGFNFLSFANIVIVGVLFAYMYIRSNNIWMPIGFHITWNYFQGAVYGFPVSGNNPGGVLTTVYPHSDIINGGVFGPEAGIASTAALLLCFLVVKWYYRKREMNFFAAQEEAAANKGE